jgi:hypothetical protein
MSANGAGNDLPVPTASSGENSSAAAASAPAVSSGETEIVIEPASNRTGRSQEEMEALVAQVRAAVDQAIGDRPDPILPALDEDLSAFRGRAVRGGAVRYLYALVALVFASIAMVQRVLVAGKRADGGCFAVPRLFSL